MIYTIRRNIAITMGVFAICITAAAQRTEIRGFGDVTASYQNKKASFGFEEQDLFITSRRLIIMASAQIR